MSKGLSIWLIFLIIASVVCDFFILKTQTYSGTTVEFSASTGDYIQVAGSNEIDIVASGVGYIRISSGDATIKAEPISGQNFYAAGRLNGGKWTVLDGSNVAINATAETPINVIFNHSVSTWVTTIFLTLLFGCLLFMLGIVIEN